MTVLIRVCVLHVNPFQSDRLKKRLVLINKVKDK